MHALYPANKLGRHGILSKGSLQKGQYRKYGLCNLSNLKFSCLKNNVIRGTIFKTLTYRFVEYLLIFCEGLNITRSSRQVISNTCKTGKMVMSRAGALMTLMTGSIYIVV